MGIEWEEDNDVVGPATVTWEGTVKLVGLIRFGMEKYF